jgi:selenocysteine lyase/cysteine desulfurase
VALDFLDELGQEPVFAHERDLLAHLADALARLPGIRIFGQAASKVPVVSFLLDGAHAHDVATLLDHEGIAVRSGHHCAHPLMQFYGVPATCVPRWRSTTRTKKSMHSYIRDELIAFYERRGYAAPASRSRSRTATSASACRKRDDLRFEVLEKALLRERRA